MSSGVQEFRRKEQNGSALSEAMPQALRLARYDARFFTNPVLFSPHSRSWKTPDSPLTIRVFDLCSKPYLTCYLFPIPYSLFPIPYSLFPNK